MTCRLQRGDLKSGWMLRALKKRTTKVASLTPALTLSDYGCFVPDLTSFTAGPCEGARRGEF